MRYALFEGVMKDILDKMEEHIAAIRNLQRNFDFHSKKLEKLMSVLNSWHQEDNHVKSREIDRLDNKSES
jgi:hypothetical protein